MSYNIDRDISLYSYAELETMQRIWNNQNANHSSIPFKLEEIKIELDKRNNPL